MTNNNYPYQDHKMPDFDEASQSQIPAILQLVNMGYTYLSRREVKELRGHNNRKYYLESIAVEALKKFNNPDISEKNIKEALIHLMGFTKTDGLRIASEEVYKLLIAGKAVNETINERRVSPQLKYIDFEIPENNTFHIAAEFEISETQNRRPDILLFVNGIPLVVIENKKSAVPVEEAITQMIRNQRPDDTPLFFLTPQILIGCNVSGFKYGTGNTPLKFYSEWKEKDLPEDIFQKKVEAVINKPVEEDIIKTVSRDLIRQNYIQIKDRRATTQDKGIHSILQKRTLLDMIKTFTIYDAGIKKIARYQQVFAINKIIKRVHEFDEYGRRKGGLVWHTQGSGKSLTMVIFVKAIIEKINNPRVIIVTDRLSLNSQIKETFLDCNIKKDVVEATTRRDLLRKIKSKTTDVITTLIGRFEKSQGDIEFSDPDKNIFILIDEAHRSQTGISNYSMNQMLPNACQIGFTGTPLMKKEKSSEKKFKGYIDIYTIKEATDDGAVLPLVYEGRFINQNIQAQMIDKFFNRITEKMSESEKKDLEYKFASRKLIQQTESRMQVIALDVDEHYTNNFKDTGLKAQLVVPSKYSAIIIKKALDDLANIKSEVIISDINISEDSDNLPQHKEFVAKYLKELKTTEGDLQKRDKRVTEDFKKNPYGVEILIVVSKLLTGFDAPRNKVLYLAKELKNHNLLQAVARVNRLFDGDKNKPKKTEGLIIDYSKNAENLKNAMELFSNYDPKDVENLFINTDDKIASLKDTYQSILEIFKTIKNKVDTEEYIQILNNLKIREDFKAKVNKLVAVFSDCLVLRDFSNKMESKEVQHLALELKKFINLKKTVMSKYGESIDFSKYEGQIRKILKDYVQAYDIELLTKPINLSDDIEFNHYIEDEKQGLSDKSKAEAIASQTAKTTSKNMDKDPIFYASFSEKIQKLLQEIKDARKEDIKHLLAKAKDYQKAVADYEDQDIPEEIKENKELHPFYRLLKKNVGTKSTFILVNAAEIIATLIKSEQIVDWYQSLDVKRKVRDSIDDYLYDILRGEQGIALPTETMDKIIEESWNIAVENREKQ